MVSCATRYYLLGACVNGRPQKKAFASRRYAARERAFASTMIFRVSTALALRRVALSLTKPAYGRAFATVEVPPPPTSNHKHAPMPEAQGSIIYTETDEAPALATYSLYPVISKVSR